MEQVSLGMAMGHLVLLAGSGHRAGVLAGWDTPFPGYSWAVERHKAWPAGRGVHRGLVPVHECHSDLAAWCHILQRAHAAWTEAILRRGGCENC